MQATSAAIAFEPVGDTSLKGKVAPVPAWRALRVVAERGGRARSSSIEAPFVGRDAELGLLKNLLHATEQEGRFAARGSHWDRAASARAGLPGSSRSTSTAWSIPSTGTAAGPRPMEKGSPSGRWARWSGAGPAWPKSDDEATTRERISCNRRRIRAGRGRASLDRAGAACPARCRASASRRPRRPVRGVAHLLRAHRPAWH